MINKQVSIKFRVYFADTDAVGIVYHANYLDFAERARTEFCREHKIDFFSLAAEGIFFVVRVANIDYLAPARLDELLEVKAYVSRMGGSSLDFVHEVYNDATRQMLAKVTTTLVCAKVVEGSATPIKIPTEISSRFTL